MWLNAMILVFWTLSLSQLFHSPLSPSSRGSFTSSSFSAIRVVSSTQLRRLIFLPEILIPACESLSWEFHMISSAYKLNKPPKMDGSLCRVLIKCGSPEKGEQITSLFLPQEHHEQYEKINLRLKLILCLICGLLTMCYSRSQQFLMRCYSSGTSSQCGKNKFTYI